ncbi:NAD(P)/FAD-dependent oxidoreductase [Pseudonocardia sp. GCM10023141]|uniref:NAD(P)/FAD-dependent oxidoreductase n=1 Tax=Pseudonocardia sp. GCM10023141 TaxID=3252653 RepID=UPI00360EE0A2
MARTKPAPLPLPVKGRPVWMADVVVIGGGAVGGAVGAAAAWQLASRGAEVVFIDPGTAPASGAGRGGARLHRAAHLDPADVALAEESFGLWREVEAETGADLLDITGSVDHGDPERLAALAAALTRHGVAHEWLDATAAAARWPGTAFAGRVLHQPDRSGRLHADQAVAALTAAAVGQGALVQHNTRIDSIALRGPAQVDVVTGRDIVRARRVVIVAGTATAGLLEGMITLPPLRATTRQVAQFPLRAAPPCGGCPAPWPSVVHHGTGADGHPITAYGVASPGEGLLAGIDGPLDALQAHVRTWFPGADADRPEAVTRVDTCAPDSSFVLESAGPVVVGAGFGPSAFTFVPALGRALADRAVGVATTAAAS